MAITHEEINSAYLLLWRFAVHRTVVVVRIAGVATAVHTYCWGCCCLYCQYFGNTVDMNHVLERFLKVIFTNYQSTFVALYWVFNRVYSWHGCWWTSGRWISLLWLDEKKSCTVVNSYYCYKGSFEQFHSFALQKLIMHEVVKIISER